MCMILYVHTIREPIIWTIMLMNFTWDHHSQTKAELLKDEGHLACRRHNIFSNMKRILREGGMSLYEHNKLKNMSDSLYLDVQHSPYLKF